MSDRKAELEKKKAKLQAIREQKERLRKEKEKKDVCRIIRLYLYCNNPNIKTIKFVFHFCFSYLSYY